MTESFLYSDENVSITNEQVRIGSSVFRTHEIRRAISTSAWTRSSWRWRAPIIGIFGLQLLLISLDFVFEFLPTIARDILYLSNIIVCAAFSILVFTTPAEHRVLLEGTFGKVIALISTERDYTKRIANEINRALRRVG